MIFIGGVRAQEVLWWVQGSLLVLLIIQVLGDRAGEIRLISIVQAALPADLLLHPNVAGKINLLR
jgi:hypothetical protein